MCLGENCLIGMASPKSTRAPSDTESLRLICRLAELGSAMRHNRTLASLQKRDVANSLRHFAAASCTTSSEQPKPKIASRLRSCDVGRVPPSKLADAIAMLLSIACAWLAVCAAATAAPTVADQFCAD